jgi:hypothetical protein
MTGAGQKLFHQKYGSKATKISGLLIFFQNTPANFRFNKNKKIIYFETNKKLFE